MRKKRKWWLILVPVLLFAVILTGLFWDEIVIRVAPKTVLKSALAKTVNSLEERFRNEPLLILAKHVDPEGKYTAELKMDTAYQLLGETSYDMTVQTNLSAHQFLAEGVVGNGGKDLDLSLYLGRDFMAVSSQELLQGNYYGITYESFGADIRGIPMLRFLIPEATLQKWEASIQAIQERMNRDYTIPEIPDISDKDLQKAMLGVMALPCEVEQEEVTVKGIAVSCKKLTYSASGAAISDVLGFILDTQEVTHGSGAISFYLYEKTLVKAELRGTAGENSFCYSLTLGIEAASDPLILQVARSENGKLTDISVTVETQNGEQVFSEKLDIRQAGKETTVAYQWNPSTGDMQLSFGEPEESIDLNLAATEDGFRIVTEDFAQLLNALEQKDEDRQEISCTMTIRKGSAIEVPAYKNLDQWSLDDFMILLSGVGSLFGLTLE